MGDETADGFCEAVALVAHYYYACSRQASFIDVLSVKKRTINLHVFWLRDEI